MREESDKARAFSKLLSLPQVGTPEPCASAVTAVESYIWSGKSNLREVFATRLYFEKALWQGLAPRELEVRGELKAKT